MKKITSLILAGAALLALAACSDDTETKVLAVPTVTLSPSSVTLSSEAVESYTINYTVSNPGDGASVSATADASWVSGIDASVSGQVRFSVAENTSEEMRTANLTLTYSYDEGTVTAKAAVVQYGVGDPVLSVDPNAVVASAEGGTYSFGYTVENPLDGESVSCTTKADWISNFDYSTYGTVSFTVAATSEQDLRTGVITVSYAGLEKEVDVVQDRIGAPSVSVSPTRISASYEEGEYSFAYTLKNPVDGETVSFTTEDEWITDITDDGNGTVTFTVGENEDLESRTGTITASYVESVKTVTVEQEANPGNWTLYGTGDYEYSVFFTGPDPGLELYQNDDDPTRFKIEHWCYDVDFLFTWDTTTNEITVDDQEIGYTYSYYGMVSIDDLSDYYDIGQSFYKDGIFYFSVAYYIGSVGTWAVGCETFTLENSTAPTYTVDDLVGTYLLYGVSNFGSEYDEEEEWTFEASDDSSKGNIMLTNYNGWENSDNPIYGTFDSDGTITFDTGAEGIYFSSFSYYFFSYDVYFVSYVAYYYSGRYGTEAYLSYLPNGSIVGPLEGDLICELLYSNGSADSWNQAFECIAGPKNTENPASLSASGKKELREAPVSDKEVNRTPLKTSKLPFTKPAK